MDSKIVKFIEQNKNRYIEELKSFLRIPSISTDPNHRKDVRQCAEFVVEELKDIGFKDAHVYDTPGHPIVFAQWLEAPGQPTVLFYGHYDVQPVDPLDLWKSPPFEPDIRNGEIYARGSADDKGQVFMHFKSLEAHLKNTGRLPVNVKLLIEGEEECGSVNLDNFIEKHREMLKADLVLISDTPMFARGVPSICYGLRGLVYFQLDLVGTSTDLHSGSFGGAVANPAYVLSKLLAEMKDESGHITIPGFYDDVRPLTERERREYASLPFDPDKFRAEIGAPQLWGEKGFSPLEQIWARPTFEINGLLAGFTGEGAKTVIPARAMAKVSMRLVPDQDPEKIAKLFENHVTKVCPKTVELKITRMHGGKAWLAPIDHPAMQAASRAYEKGFGKKPVFVREGGSIPVVATFAELLKVPSVLIGIGLPDENAHAPNEKLDLGNFQGGILSTAHLYQELAK
ncbi:MAG TPA: dipeptidase [Acidobacteriota bacterium]|jgi:acetylornithine deacetylase/succinyl-diaminopimelate desuccinylase-like protein